MLEPAFFSALLLIITINIVLSGDNAVVIAIACRRLTPPQRKKAIIWATGLAIIVRIIATALAVYLLKIPYLYLIGGLILIWISYKLLREEEGSGQINASDNLVQAVKTIVLADVMMGLDNVLAIAGAAGGNMLLIILGLLISIPIMVFGSQLILKAMERIPWLVYFGSGILAWAAAKMIFEERLVAEWVQGKYGVEEACKIVIVSVVLVLGYIQRKKSSERKTAEQRP
ncbi:TerC family protein [Brevibacillus ruminantium]|uniref:TerC family protein n=1 Tax=Brevibacillus ruminantium TaxID=2950604 RepID=A0ABY4WRU8_9BACL|nr:TerC family protein [Brevibacillus ruminantium]USG67316.1 TerC family protein [Brevibacillus ruminantium]